MASVDSAEVPRTEEAPELVTSTDDSAQEVEHSYEYKVKMTCGGCSGAVTRVLKRAQDEGLVREFDVSLEDQSVHVKGTIGFEELTAKIAKTGKQILESKEVTPESGAPAVELETPAQVSVSA